MKHWLQLGKGGREHASPRDTRVEVIYERAFGTHEKRVPLTLRIMFGKPLDILKYGEAAQIRRAEMHVAGLEGDLAVPQISFVPSTQVPPQLRDTGCLLGPCHPLPLVLPHVFPRGGQLSPLNRTPPL